MLGAAITLSMIVSPGGAVAAGSRPGDAQVDHALSVSRDGPEPRIVDDHGRQVLLRGVNVNQLGDYYRAVGDSPPVLELTGEDAEGISEIGFNVVRLVVSWSRFEPVPGVIDESALDDLERAVDLFAAQDLYTVIDMHQDAWSKWVATPAGTACPEGRRPAIGWDGAPQWATITDGASTCIAGQVREADRKSVG